MKRRILRFPRRSGAARTAKLSALPIPLPPGLRPSHNAAVTNLANIRKAAGGFLLRRWAELSGVGLITGTLSFAASLTPSLLPRHFVVQGALSGLAFAVGYGVGRFVVFVWEVFQIRVPGPRLRRVVKWSLAAIATLIAGAFLAQATRWQNSIRTLMAMEPEATAYPFRVALIAAGAATLFIGAAMCVQGFWRIVDRRLERVLPPRISFVASTVLVATLLVLILNNVFARYMLRAADQVFLRMDSVLSDDEELPADPLASGSAQSLISWKTIGRRGREFVAAGPKQDEIAAFLDRPAKRPIRVYAGYRSMEDVDARARLALDELKRVGGFERSVLIVATPTGTGWLDSGAVDTVEYLHAGDTAIVAMGYSYLPSWMTLLVDPERSRDSARALFNEVYEYWKTLPHDRRPKLYLHGLSLGSLGAEACTDLYTLIGDPIHGGVFSGPPFPSPTWKQISHDRNADSPSWLPRFHDGSVVRFTGRRSSIDDATGSWGPLRIVYIQHPSDPMVFFSPDLAWREPEWLRGRRGPDVSPYLTWWPMVTSLQIGFDLPMATNVPLGYGHNYDAGSYIDAWVAVTDPPDWSAELTRALKAKFAGKSSAPSLSSP